MPTCRYCGTEQPENAFPVAAVVKGITYRRRKCQTCKYARQKERIEETRRWLQEFKRTLVCEQCGFADFRALEFHHRDPHLKEFAVGDIARRGGSLVSLQREIAKCSVLCANCHRIQHFEEDGA